MTKPFDPNKPFTDGAERPGRLLRDDIKGPQPLAIAIDRGDFEALGLRYADGRYSTNAPSVHDLINVPTKRKGWIGVRPMLDDTCNAHTSNGSYLTENDARFATDNRYSQYIEIEFGE